MHTNTLKILQNVLYRRYHNLRAVKTYFRDTDQHNRKQSGYLQEKQNKKFPHFHNLVSEGERALPDYTYMWKIC